MKNPNPGAVISLSGGLDSTTVLGMAVGRYGKDKVHAIGFDYGQKHAIELQQAEIIADWYGVPFEIIRLPRIFSGAGSSLVDPDVNIEQSFGSYEELANRFGSQPTVVPNRNMNLLAMTVTYALTKGVGTVMMGVHAGDASNFHYPDCRPAFIGAMAAAVEIATEGAIVVEAPFNHSPKSQLVVMAALHGVPLHLTQSCYQGKRPACGVCATCLERINAFAEAGYMDPIKYEVPPNWKSLEVGKSIVPFPAPNHFGQPVFSL